MTRFLPVLLALGLLASATPTGATCRWFGSQVDCDVGRSQLVLGTQTAAVPRYGAGLRPQTFRGGDALLDGRRVPPWPLRLEVQNVGADPSLCRTLGNETYCY